MRKMLWTAVILCLLAALPLAGAGAYTTTPELIQDDAGQAILHGADFAYWWYEDDGLYMSGNPTTPTQLFRWDFGQDRIELVETDLFGTFGEEQHNRFATADGLYSLSTRTGTLHAYSKAGWEPVITLDLTTLASPGNGGSGDLSTAHHFVVQDTLLYFLLPTVANGDILVEADLESGVCTRHDALAFDALAPYTDGALLAYREEGVYALALDTLTVGDDALFAADKVWGYSVNRNETIQSPAPFTYDGDADLLYYVADETLCRFSVHSGDHETLRALVTHYSAADNYRPEEERSDYGIDEMTHTTYITKMCMLPDGRLAFSYYDAIFLVHPSPQDAPASTLKIAGFTEPVLYEYHLLHPALRIETWYFGLQYSDPRGEMPEQYPMDVHRISTEDGYRSLYRGGDLHSLAGAPGVKAAIDTYYPILQEALTYEGEPMGLPYMMEIDPWTYHKDAWEALELPDPPETMDELFALIETWNADYAEEYPEVSLLESWQAGGLTSAALGMIDQYIFANATEDAPVPFDTLAFRTLLTRFEGTTLISSARRNTSYPLLLCGYQSWPLYQSLPTLGKNGYVPILPARLDDETAPKIGAILYYYVMPENAPNPDTALDYFSFMAAHMDPALDAMLRTDWTEPVPYAQYDTLLAGKEAYLELIKKTETGSDSEAEERQHEQMHIIESMQASPYQISAEMLDFYHGIAPLLTLEIDAIGGTNKARDDMPSYVGFEIAQYLWAMQGQEQDPYAIPLPFALDHDSFITYLNETAETVFAHRH